MVAASGRGFPLRPGCAVSRDGLYWYRVPGPYRGALLDAGAEGEFDEFMVGWPQVIQWDDGSWRMYYHTVQLGKGYFLAWAESPDGFRWHKRGLVMGPGPKGRFDDYGVATRHIVKLGDTWTMFYEGCHFIGDPIQVDRQIGVATSMDGVNWQRIDGPPCQRGRDSPGAQGLRPLGIIAWAVHGWSRCKTLGFECTTSVPTSVQNPAVASWTPFTRSGSR